MSVRSQSAFLRKAGTLTVWLIILCIYFLGVYNYVQIRNDTAVSVFLSAAYPDRKGAENILKQERKSEKPYDVCFYADAGLREISAKEGNRQAQAMTVYLKGNPAGYDWQAAALTEGDPDGCVIDDTTAWELFGNKVPGGQILFQGRTYTVRKVADWGQKILVFGAASADGYFATNIFDYEYSYFIGKEAAGQIISYVQKHSTETMSSTSLPTISGTVTEIGNGYIMVDDTVLCKKSKAGKKYKVYTDDIKIRRWIESGELKEGDLVIVEYEGEISSNYEVKGAYSIFTGTLEENGILNQE